MLKIGKLDSELLKKIVFENIKFKRPEVLTRPGIGEDCAVIDYGEYECVLSTDPITAAIEKIGSLAVHISCNDIASNGIEPLGIMLAVMLPEGTKAEEIEEMMKQAGKANEELGVEIIGGHTEITSAVNKPIIVSTAVGRGKKGQSSDPKDMSSGDAILMTKFAGLEGTGIIATDLKEELGDILTNEEIEEGEKLLEQVSVVKEGVIAGKIGTSGMHDVTEGGILGAIWEMCNISGLGAEIWEEEIPVMEITKKIARKYDMNYLRLISSGSMVIVTPEKNKKKIIKEIEEAGVKITQIGIVKEAKSEIILKKDDKLLNVDPPEGDELYKAIK